MHLKDKKETNSFEQAKEVRRQSALKQSLQSEKRRVLYGLENMDWRQRDSLGLCQDFSGSV